MVLRKNFLVSLKFLFLVLFMLLCVSYSTNCKAVDFTYCQLTYDDVSTLFDKLNINTNYNYWSGDVAISNFVTSFNAWARTMAVQDGFSWNDYDVIFTRLNSGSNIYWVLNSCQVGTNPDFILNPLNITNVTNSSPSYSNVSGWASWTRDSNNIVNGFNKKTILSYQMNPLATYPSVTSNSISNTWQIPVAFSGENITSLTPTSLSTTYEVYTPTLIVWEPHYLKFGYTEIYGNNTLNGLGYKTFRLTNLLQTSPVTPTPTPIPTSSGGGGGGSTDLTETNSLIGEVKDSVDELGSLITDEVDMSGESISSGDILNSLGFQLMEDPYDNFWLFFVTNLRVALLDEVRQYNIDFLGNHYVIDLDELGFPVDSRVKASLRLFSVLVACWAILKLFKVSADMIQSANIDRVLELNEEEGFIDFF